MTLTRSTFAKSTDELEHRDANGVLIEVGDTVRFGDAEGVVLILERWQAKPWDRPGQDVPACYVSHIGHWGDCRAVEAERLVKVQVSA